jgi:hypothetical protein
MLRDDTPNRKTSPFRNISGSMYDPAPQQRTAPAMTALTRLISHAGRCCKAEVAELDNSIGNCC